MDTAPFGATVQSSGSLPSAKQSLSKTMVMGGESVTAASLPGEALPRQTDASPLSHSVLAPQPWVAPGAAPALEASRIVSVGAPAAPARATMVGTPATDLMPPAGSAPPRVERLDDREGRAPPPPASHKTMMGVAIPGIAPLLAGAAPTADSAPSPTAGPSRLRSNQSTMLGIAIPGIAPTHGAPPSQPHHPYGTTKEGYAAPAPHIPSQVQNTSLGMMAAPEIAIVPRPKTLINEPFPLAPVIAPKRGLPAAAVVRIVAALVLALGGLSATLAVMRGATLTAVTQGDENGRESLRIACVSCPDGTTVSLGAASATFAGGAATLLLPAPLSVGDNALSMKIDRPGAGRDEEVKVHVPLAYRARTDLATLDAKPPAITVRVEAVVGSDVKIEDKAVTLDATGRGAYAIDLSKETDGTGEAKTFERKIVFVVTPKGGAPQSGQLTARAGIVALALDAPGTQLFTDKPTAAIAGQTRPGATVTIDGQSVPVDAQGRFGVRVELASPGEKPLEIIASAAPLAPRIAKVVVVRVASLAAAAKGLEEEAPIAFDAFGADPASKIGQKAVVEGEVVDVRAGGGHTVLLVDTKRGCAKGATCLVRVVHGEEDKAVRGDVVRAYGLILGSVTASGQTVPELQASLVLASKASR